jgi:O-antigen/teichoic acid export membrane protein
MVNGKTGQGERPRRLKADKFGRYEIPVELLRFDTLIDVALIVLGVYILQAFISTNVTDTAARVSIVAWAIAIPLLAFLALLNRTQEGFRYTTNPAYLVAARGIALGAAVIGFGAAVWHLWIPASIVLVASGFGGLVLYRVYEARLRRDNALRDDGPAGSSNRHGAESTTESSDSLG